VWRIKKPETPWGDNAEPKDLQTNQPQTAAPVPGEGTTKMNKTLIRPWDATNDRATTRLGSSLHVKGDVCGNEDLYIDGEIEGQLQLNGGNLTVGRTAKLTANITAGQVVVYGSVKGNVCANRIEIKKDGSVVGDLTTPQILIEDGAYFKGSIEIGSAANKDADKDVPPLTDPPVAKSAAAGAAPKST